MPRVSLPVVLLAGRSVHGQFGLDRPQQPDLRCDLGGQVLIRDCRVVPVQVNGRCRGSLPLQGRLLPLLVARGAGDQAGELAYRATGSRFVGREKLAWHECLALCHDAKDVFRFESPR